jgi:hypothetical protein
MPLTKRSRSTVQLSPALQATRIVKLGIGGLFLSVDE